MGMTTFAARKVIQGQALPSVCCDWDMEEEYFSCYTQAVKN